MLLHLYNHLFTKVASKPTIELEERGINMFFYHFCKENLYQMSSFSLCVLCCWLRLRYNSQRRHYFFPYLIHFFFHFSSLFCYFDQTETGLRTIRQNLWHQGGTGGDHSHFFSIVFLFWLLDPNKNRKEERNRKHVQGLLWCHLGAILEYVIMFLSNTAGQEHRTFAGSVKMSSWASSCRCWFHFTACVAPP